jgi:hypothetical protein
MGPVEVVVLGFARVSGVSSVVPELERLVVGGHLRIVDAVLVTIDASGGMIVSDIQDEDVPGWSSISPDPHPLLSADDAALVAANLHGQGAALIIAVEQLWPASFEAFVVHQGGVLYLHALIDPAVVWTAAFAGQ